MVTPAAKDLSIQSLRGLAVVLMVAGHVIGNEPDAGLRVADDSAWRFGYTGLADLRMPLFTVISGVVYGFRPVTRPVVPQFLRGKALRLLVPLVVVGTVFFFVQLAVPGTNYKPDPTDLWKVYVLGFGHLWFLQSMFVIFVLVGLLDALGFFASARRWLAAFAGSLLLATPVLPEIPFLSLTMTIGILPFFLLGYGLVRHAEALRVRSAVPWLVPLFLALFAVRLATLDPTLRQEPWTLRALGLGVGVTGIALLFAFRQLLAWRPLAWLGGFSFGIYLLHVFGAAGVRIVLTRLGLDDTVVLFLVGLAAGIALPVLFEVTLGRSRVVSRLVLGAPAPPRTSRPETIPAPRAEDAAPESAPTTSR